MANNAEESPRAYTPLVPDRSVVLVSGGKCIELSGAEVKRSLIGHKAYGLCSIPTVWVLPFFVISGDEEADSEQVGSIVKHLGLEGVNVLIRSSGIDETIDERGVNSSFECNSSQICNQLRALPKGNKSRVHWVVQKKATVKMKGHLSNERRLYKNDRDWLAEIEAGVGHPCESQSIAIRNWRDARYPEPKQLKCFYKESYTDRLNEVARWAYKRKLRVHFEWVWDGNLIYIVQADEEVDDSSGMLPEKIISEYSCEKISEKLNVFRRISKDDFTKYKKINNVQTYREVGYFYEEFYILNDAGKLNDIINNGTVCNDLRKDLSILASKPLIIRTDGMRIPCEKRRMLPRSNELRSQSDAVEWLLSSFKEEVITAGIKECELCLIAHHFIPSVASAWCQAHADQRKVRIESLWGIPEGLYWHSHDVYDVDTKVSGVLEGDAPNDLPLRKKIRYKGQFLAPNESGYWVLHKTAWGPDWKSSISKQKWIYEIAWASRKIAQKCGHSVVVMWFVDIPESISRHNVLPWYHEEWEQRVSVRKASLSGRSNNLHEHTISTETDWYNLRERCNKGEVVSRVIVDPKQPELVRNAAFAKSLGNLARDQGFVVQLSGGILSHAYYLLRKTGCAVEFSDLYATSEDEIEYNKLVRDRIPEKILSGGETVKAITLKGDALITSLKRKILEEAFEVMDATNVEQIASEIADLQEVQHALMKELKIAQKHVDELRKKKIEKVGGFDSKTMLVKTSLDPAIKEQNSMELIDELLPIESISQSRTALYVSELPKYRQHINVDKRYTENDSFEYILKFSTPVYSNSFHVKEIYLEAPGTTVGAINLSLEVTMDRNGSDFNFKVRIINAPSQGELPFELGRLSDKSK